MIVDTDIDLKTVLGSIIAAVSIMVGLYTRAMNIRQDSLQESQKELELDQKEIWMELKLNRESNIRLSGSIDRLNELLPRVEHVLDMKVSHEQCSLRRRSTDTCVVEQRTNRGNDEHTI